MFGSAFLFFEILLSLRDPLLEPRLSQVYLSCLEIIDPNNKVCDNTDSDLIYLVVRAVMTGFEGLASTCSDGSFQTTTRCMLESLSRVEFTSDHITIRILDQLVFILPASVEHPTLLGPLLDCILAHVSKVDASSGEERIGVRVVPSIISTIDTHASLRLDPSVFSRLLDIIIQATPTCNYQDLLEDPILRSALVDILGDPENIPWDVQDYTLKFLGAVFSSCQRADSGWQGLWNVFGQLVTDDARCHVFVRASAAAAIVHCFLGKGLDEAVVSKLVQSVVKQALHDPEAIVRRSCFQGLDRLIVESVSVAANPCISDDQWKSIVSSGCRDTDWEVRKTTIGLLVSMMEHRYTLFKIVDGSRLICDLVNDDSRSVKETVYYSLLAMRKFGILVSAGSKRGTRMLVTDDDDTDEDVIHLCGETIDLREIREKSVAEGLYDEALVFEVDGSMIREHDMLNDGNNILTCYDC